MGCLGLSSSDGNDLTVSNTCPNSIQIAPEGCTEPCEEALVLASNETGTLTLRGGAENGAEQVFAYRNQDQAGKVTLTYVLNQCQSEDGCAAAPLPGAPSVTLLTIPAFFCVLVSIRAGRSRVLREKRKALDLALAMDRAVRKGGCASTQAVAPLQRGSGRTAR